MVERWFRYITDKAIRRGGFTGVPALITAIERYLTAHNAKPRIFTWTKDVDTILAKVTKCKYASGTPHQRISNTSLWPPRPVPFVTPFALNHPGRWDILFR
jgi:hypothetical protein